MNYQDNSLKSLKLGQKTEYASQYDRTLLQPVPRALNRDGLGITQNQPFTIGADIWTAYEISWLNEKACHKWLSQIFIWIIKAKI